MRTSHRVVGAVACAVSLAFAAPAFAHPGGMGPGAGSQSECGQGMAGMGMRGGGHGMGSMGMQGDHAAAAGGHLASLKTELKITAAQEAAWNAFAAKAAKQMEGMQGSREKMRDGAVTAPERFAQRAEVMKQRVTGMEGISTALRDLYAAFTPEQKAIADEHFAGHGPGALASNGPRR